MTTPVRDRHTRRREQTRAKLVEAARTLFARQGVDNTRINEITDEADVGFGSFYNHFDSKEAIVEAVLAETVAAQGEAIEAVTRQLEDPAEVIAAAAPPLRPPRPQRSRLGLAARPHGGLAQRDARRPRALRPA